MVSFSRTPYDEAMNRAKQQDKYLAIGCGILTGITAIGGYFLARKYVENYGTQLPWQKDASKTPNKTHSVWRWSNL